MAKHLEIDDGEPTEAPKVRLKRDGTPWAKTGRKPAETPQTVPSEAHAAPPLRRNNPRPPPREQTREPAREPARTQSTVLGRNGEVLERMRPNAGGDIFDRVQAPPGWTLQWNAVSAVNKEIDEIHKGMAIDMYENGWRPVPASRYPGIWTPPGYDGAIIVKGMRLEERPIQLTQQAQREDEARAKAQLRDQTDSLRLTQSKLPGANAGRARQVSGMRMEIDRSFDLPPDENYDYGDSGE